MSSKPAKKVAKKATPKKTIAKKAPSPGAPLKKDPLAAGLSAAQQELQNMTPDQQRAQAKALMAKLISDVSRVTNQTSFLLDTNQKQYSEVTGRLDYLDACVAMIAEALHIQLPERLPAILDAKVELLRDEQIPEGEAWEMRAVSHEKPHPVYGNVEVIIGVGEEARSETLTRLHPIVAARLAEAFKNLETEGTLEHGYFYTVRLHMVHAGRVNESSVALEGTGGDVEQA